MAQAYGSIRRHQSPELNSRQDHFRISPPCTLRASDSSEHTNQNDLMRTQGRGLWKSQDQPVAPLKSEIVNDLARPLRQFTYVRAHGLRFGRVKPMLESVLIALWCA